MKLRNYWKSIDNQRKFFDDAAVKLNIKDISDWKNVNLKQIFQLRGAKSILSKYYNNSLFLALKTVYHDTNFEQKEFATRSYWKIREAQIEFVENFAKERNFKSLEDWYSVTNIEVKKHGGSALIDRHYSGSLSKLLKSVYPNYDWSNYKLKKHGNNYWNSAFNQRNFFIKFAKEKNISRMEDWYSVKPEEINNFGGATILSKYPNYISAIQANFPEYTFDIIAFKNKPPNFWNSKENQLLFMQQFAALNGIKELNDWYFVKQTYFKVNGGGNILAKYNNSLFFALTSLYPNHSWDILKSGARKKNYFSDLTQLSSFIFHLQQFFQITRIEDWYRISSNQLLFINAYSILNFKKTNRDQFGLYYALKAVHSDQKWQLFAFKKRDKKSAQRLLFIHLCTIFSKFLLLESYKHPMIIYQSTGLSAEFDVFVPSFNIVFEYQGEQHYDELIGGFGFQEILKNRDNQKRLLCKRQNICIIEIPYWWNFQVDSLFSYIANNLNSFL